MPPVVYQWMRDITLADENRKQLNVNLTNSQPLLVKASANNNRPELHQNAVNISEQATKTRTCHLSSAHITNRWLHR